MHKQLPSETNRQMRHLVCYSVHVHKLDHKSTTYTLMYKFYYNFSMMSKTKIHEPTKKIGWLYHLTDQQNLHTFL